MAIPGQNGALSEAYRAVNKGTRTQDKDLDRRGSPLLAKRAQTSQPSAPYQFKLISTADGQDANQQDAYYYDDDAGSKTRVYIIDSGITASHPASSNAVSSHIPDANSDTTGVQRYKDKLALRRTLSR